MNRSHIELLKNEYDRVCDEYLIAFCNNFDLPYEKDAWVAGNAGTVASIGDYYFDFNDVIKYCVDNNLTDFDEVLEWYDYRIDAESFGIETPNFPSWHKGCPRLTSEQLDNLCEKRKELNELVAQYKNNTKNTSQNG